MQSLSKKYLILTLLGVFTILLIGVLSPKIVESYSSNWNSEFEQIKSNITERVSEKIFNKEETITKLSSEIVNQTSERSNVSSIEFLEIITSNVFKKVSINIFNSDNKLIGWNKDRVINIKKLEALKEEHSGGGVFFLKTPLVIYLAKIDFSNSYLIMSAIPIEKRYRISQSDFDEISLTKELKNEFDANITIKYDTLENFNNGIKIRNSAGSQIGSLIIANISRDADVAKLAKNIELIQSMFLILTLFFLLLWIYQKVKNKEELIKLSFLILSILFLRFLFYWLNLVELLNFSNLVNPIYFSSTFGDGITKSPLELFITIITVLIIVYKLYKYINKLSKNNYSNSKIIFAAILFSSLSVLLYNSFASTVRSVIFDSSILYFKDAVLFGNYQTSFMYLNILLIGLIAVLFSISIITFLVSAISKISSYRNSINFILLFLFVTIILLIDEIVFLKSSVFLVIIYSILVFSVTYYWVNLRSGKYSGILILLLSSSILSISFLNFFNSELERNSLRRIANELTRSNVELYEYYVEDALRVIQKEAELFEMVSAKETDLNEVAFSLWTKTELPFRTQSSVVNIIDVNKNLLGSFNYKYNEEFQWRWGDELIKNGHLPKSLYDVQSAGVKTISAITPIINGDSLVGYVEVNVRHDGFWFDFVEDDKILSTLKPAVEISVNPDLLKIFEFKNGELVNYFTNILLTDEEESLLINAVLAYEKDAWLNIQINNENNIFYVKNSLENGDTKTLAVGLSDQDITWNLYDFFKVFFIHSIMILIFILFLVFINFKKWKDIRISFKTKILFSLLIVSIIPIILLAVYFKGISDEKNSDAVNYKLGKRADSVEEYINNYVNASTLTEKMIFEKAVRDLGIRFSLFEGEELLFSSEGNYYLAGILPKIISPLAYLSLNKDGVREVIIKENFENISFNSLYHRAFIAGKEYTIKISDVFNKFQLPLTGIELNVFLFGTYSLAIILIIILSTFLANQISAPIEKLTKATRSVSHGDMDIQIKNIESGEIKELIEGFNLMVRELKKNQVELAEVERESAWREMAKQVAHEIKNPLTPMKLAVQHLVIAHKDKSEKFDSIFDKVTKTIITQIDTLKNIASEFSSFAKMPSIKLEEVDLVKIANETIDLFIEEKCGIKVDASERSIILMSDKEQTQRMFVNLIRNAIQANAKEINILISLSKEIIGIEINDNGDGIDKEIKLKIFDENFTTKESGMGLGLTLTKRFLNMIGGKISVRETSSNGTTLFIEIENK
ncbi:MAG: ATP-binding protein [Melioribacteraceae bacterium]|nr:ATP-binding protein [Melioribacteraceae bacterium]